MAGGGEARKSGATFERGLERRFRDIEGGNPFLLLALADAAGLAPQAQAWLAQRAAERPLRLGPHGERSAAELLAAWSRLRTSTAEDAFAALCAFTPQRAALLFVARDLVVPLALAGRAEIVPSLFAQLLDAGFEDTFEINTIAIDLARAGAGEALVDVHALWQERYGTLVVAASYEDLAWKHVYHQGLAESVLPRLVALPPPETERAEHRRWQAMAYRIRAGRSDLRVPVIPRDRQPNGYYRAAAMQIAALEHDPSAREHVAALRRVLGGGRSMTIQHVNRGITLNMNLEPEGFLAERIMIAARRRDHAAVQALARAPSDDGLAEPADLAIEAYLEEGDWRGAAAVASAHDPRRRPVRRGFDDTRKQDHLALQMALAAAAARGGDPAAAQEFLAAHKLAALLMPDPERAEEDERPAAPAPAVDPWPAALIAGVAEGRLPGRHIGLLLPLFTRAA